MLPVGYHEERHLGPFEALFEPIAFEPFRPWSLALTVLIRLS